MIKRAYEPAVVGDGLRILVDRLWPRGVTKEQLAIDQWLKELSPSDELRRWFGHKEERWAEFLKRYSEELDEKQECWQPLLEKARHQTVTLVYGAKEPERNNAIALMKYLEAKLL